MTFRRIIVFFLLVTTWGCTQKMADQPKFVPHEPTSFFPNRNSARHPPAGTVPRGYLEADTHLYKGLVQGVPAKEIPFPVTKSILERGQERYNIYCAPCHGRDGRGQGLIVTRGFPEPPSFHTDKLRRAPAGHFFRVITDGQGAMYSYSDKVSPEDRWAVTAYIRTLQYSQHVPIEKLPELDRRKVLKKGGRNE